MAKTTVTAKTKGEEVVLDLNGTLQNQIAIALLDLEGVTELYGDAIRGTEYALAYDPDTDRYELNVTETGNARIGVEGSNGISYIVLLPNETKGGMIKCWKDGRTCAYTFHNGVKGNKIYCRTASDGVAKEALAWSEYEEPEMPETPDANGHEYVDLGLPSGLKWATCNVGASKPEDYGDYFAWGETKTKESYDYYNSLTYGLGISELESQGYIDENGNLTSSHDAATANWGGSWRMPTEAEQRELINNCEWEWTTQNGVKGYKVTGTNGNSIFLPAAGYRDESSLYDAGSYGYYWSSTPYGSDSRYAWYLYFRSDYHDMDYYYRDLGQSVRPVSE